MRELLPEFWSLPAETVLASLDTTHRGLTRAEAQKRLSQAGDQQLRAKPRTAALALLLVTVALPYLPFNHWLGLTPLPLSYLLTFGAITLLYLLASEVTKKFVYRRAQF